MVRIVTDTASDITYAQAMAMRVTLVSLDINFEDGPQPQRDEEDFTEFYRRLATCEHLPQTSRPSPQAYMDVYLEAECCDEDVVVLCVSGGLSGTYESAVAAKNMCGYQRVHVIDTHQAILTQRMLVEEAVRLRNKGCTAREIVQHILSLRDKVRVCGVVGTLKFLRKGGRIPASLAVLGEMLHVKPVIILKDTMLSAMGKVRGYVQGMSMLHKQMEQDGFDASRPVYFGYTSDPALGKQLCQATVEKYGLQETRMHPIGGIIGTHCGTDCMAVAYFMK